jgi:ankyrin repeat protein
LEYFNPGVKNKDGDTPLLVACKNSRPKVAGQMLQMKEQALKVRNNAGDLPLHAAVKQLISTRSRSKTPGDKTV